MLYYHVGDKKALYEAVIANLQLRSRGSLEKVLADGGDPRDMLRKAIQLVGETAFEYPVFPSIVLREVASGGIHMGEESISRLESMLSLVRRIIERGVQAGVMRPVDPAFAQFIVAGSVMFLAAGVPFRKRLAEKGAPSGPLEPGEVVEKLYDLMMRGLSPEGTGHVSL
jgi:AcrR family transcriptional regulator